MTTVSSTGMSLDSATIMQRSTERFSTRIRFARTSHGVRLQMSKTLDATPVRWPMRAPQLSVTRKSTVVARTSPAEKLGACFLSVESAGSTRFQWRYASLESPTRSRSWPGVKSTWCTPFQSVAYHTFSQREQHVNQGLSPKCSPSCPHRSSAMARASSGKNEAEYLVGQVDGDPFLMETAFVASLPSSVPPRNSSWRTGVRHMASIRGKPAGHRLERHGLG